jgi:hypothetical protein
MFWAPVACRRKDGEVQAWKWVGYVHGTRGAVITRERNGGAHVVYAAKRYVGHFPWLSDAREEAAFAATEVPYQIIDLVVWMLALVRHQEPTSASVPFRVPNCGAIRPPHVKSASVRDHLSRHVQ